MERYVLHVLPGEKPGMEYVMRGKSLIVASVRPASAAADAGVPEGCVVAKMNGTPIDSAAALLKELRASRHKMVLDVHRGGSERAAAHPLDAVVLMPGGRVPGAVRAHRSYLRVTATTGEELREVSLRNLSHATTMELPGKGRGAAPTVVACLHTIDDSPQLLLADVDIEALFDVINARLEKLDLPPLPIDENEASPNSYDDDDDDGRGGGGGTTATGGDSGGGVGGGGGGDDASSSYDGEPLSPPILRGIRAAHLTFHCSIEAVATVEKTGLCRASGVLAEELPDTFASVKPLLARRGGALVYYAAVCREGVVLVGSGAVYRWLPDESTSNASPDLQHSRCMAFGSVSEMVVGLGETTGLVALRMPRQHDELLSLPASSLDCWERTVSVLFRLATGHDLPIRRVGVVKGGRAAFAKKLYLAPPRGYVPPDPIPLTYRHDIYMLEAASVAAQPAQPLRSSKAADEAAELRRSIDNIEALLKEQQRAGGQGGRGGGVGGVGGGDDLESDSGGGGQVSFSPAPTYPVPELLAPPAAPPIQILMDPAGSEHLYTHAELMSIKAKQQEVAALRSLVDVKQQHETTQKSQRQQQLAAQPQALHAQQQPPSPVYHTPPAPAPSPYMAAAPDYAYGHHGASPSPAAHSTSFSERDFLREQVDVLSQQLREMVGELGVMQDKERDNQLSQQQQQQQQPPSHAVSPPPPLASLDQEVQERLQALEAATARAEREDVESERDARSMVSSQAGPPPINPIAMEIDNLAALARGAAQRGPKKAAATTAVRIQPKREARW
eukprot:Rhum_TRINITY_DN14135_c11_g1::Rhum_TRINITY_DN14135_c11_g1_i1::g.70486::m.70486